MFRRRCRRGARHTLRARPAAGPNGDRAAGDSAAPPLATVRGHSTRAVRPLSSRSPVLLSCVGRSVFVSVVEAGVIPRAPHRRHHGRLVEHAVAVQRPAAEDAERHGVLQHHGGGGVLHPHAHEGPLSRPDRARAVRQRGVRHYAVHDGLREPAAQPENDQRRQRMAAVPRSGHHHHESDRRRASICSTRSIFSSRLATSW